MGLGKLACLGSKGKRRAPKAKSAPKPNVAKLVDLLNSKKSVVSDFAIIDIKAGRGAVADHFDMLPDAVGPTPEEFRVPFVIHGYLDHINSGNDGESQEFAATVEKIEFLHQPKPDKRK